MGRVILFLTTIFLTCCLQMAEPAQADTGPWARLDRGLFFGEFFPETAPQGGDCGICVLRIDPLAYDLQVFSASEYNRKPRTISRWTEDFSLVAAINASMYQGVDVLKSTGYMRNYRHTNNPHINRSFGAFLAFNPVVPSLPRVQFIDRRLQKDWRETIGKYHSVVQNYRMISFGKKRGWPQQAQRHGAAAIGLDIQNRLLFILSRTALSTHDLILALLALPIDIRSAMYVEGGPQAALQIRSGSGKVTRIGICSENFVVSDHVFEFEIPNIIGIRKRN